jgi:tetratricopeptide (TPR) repeat protein
MNKVLRLIEGLMALRLLRVFQIQRHLLLLTAVLLVPAVAMSQSLTKAEQLIEQLCEIQLNVTDKAKAEEALKLLLQDAESYRDANPEQAEAWLVTARIRAVYARSQGMSALAMAKQVKAEFEKAIALNPVAQQGMAQGYLGNVYLSVPGWPLSYGDADKGVQMMQDTLAANPDNALINLFFAQYLVAEKQYQEAQGYVNKASEVINADAAHPLWQQLQQRNIANLQQTITEKL